MGFASSFAHHIGFPAAGFHKPGLGIIELSVKKQEEMVIKDLIGNEIRNPKSDLNVFVESVETSI